MWLREISTLLTPQCCLPTTYLHHEEILLLFIQNTSLLFLALGIHIYPSKNLKLEETRLERRNVFNNINLTKMVDTWGYTVIGIHATSIGSHFKVNVALYSPIGSPLIFQLPNTNKRHIKREKRGEKERNVRCAIDVVPTNQ